MKKDNRILKSVNNLIANQEIKDAINNLITLIPSKIKFHEAIFNEMKSRGYNEEQAFKFASKATLNMFYTIRPSSTNEEDEF